VGVYRKYLDNPVPVSDNDMTELKNAFSRSGFTDGYLTGKLGKQMMSHKNPANNSGSTFTAEAKLRAEGKFVRKIPIDIYASLYEGDVFRVTAYGKDGLCVVGEGSETAQTPQSRPLDRTRIEEQLKKLGDTPFEAKTVTVEVDKNVTVPIKEINKVRRDVCDLLWNELCHINKRQVNNAEIIRKEKRDVPNMYLTAEVMTREQGSAVIKAGGIKRIYAPCDVAQELSQLDCGVEIVTRASDILSCDDIKTEAVSVSSLGAMVRYGERAKYGEWRLNVYNSLTANAMSGLSCITISPELNLRDIAEVVSYLPDIDAELIGYGRIPLMIMKNCPIKALGRCQNGKNIYKLRDRKGMEFPIICSKGCNAVLLNSKPIYTADMIDEIRKTKINCIRLNFTVEKSEECGKIVNIYRKALEGEIPPSMAENTFTRGHLKRGV
jgi:putative protease